MNFTGRHIEGDRVFVIVLIDETHLEDEFRQGDDRVTAHGAVAFVVKKKNVQVSISRRRYNRAIHVGMAAGLPHCSPAYMIIVFAEITALLEHGCALDRR